MSGNEDCAVKQSKPECGNRNYLYAQWNGFVLSEVLDIASQTRVAHQPVV